MDAALHDLIRRTKDNTLAGKYRNGDVSHVIFLPQQQFLTIRRDKLSEFWEGYCRLVYNGEGIYALAEVNERDMPVVTGMTFQFNKDNVGDNELFTDKFLIEMIYAWQQAIADKQYLSETRSELTCVSLESERSWQEGNSAYFQVRLQFPLCRTESSSISKIREKAISILRRRNALKELQVSPENDWDKIVDPHVHLEPLLLYKSVRAIGRPKMTLTAIYGEITEEHLEKNVVPVFRLEDAFDPRAHSYVNQGLISEEIFDANNDRDKADPLFWLPLILSVNYSNAIVLAKNEITLERFVSSDEGQIGFSETNSALAKAQFFLQFLSQERAVDPFSWRDVGRALYSSSEGSEEGLQVWIDFSEQSDTFTSEDCMALWRTFESESHITYKTIAWYAK